VLKAHVDTLKKREKKNKKTASATAHFTGCAHIFIIADFSVPASGISIRMPSLFVQLLTF
jgi:hypothetical protein